MLDNMCMIRSKYKSSHLISIDATETNQCFAAICMFYSNLYFKFSYKPN